MATPDTTSQGHHATYLATRHFGSLDGLRFLCITLVIWHHAGIWPNLEADFFSRGHTGVDFFFALSGYLITTLLLREEDRNGSFSLRGFYWRRFLRIVPIFYFAITLAAVYEFVLKGQWANLDILPYYYLFLSNFIDGRDIAFLSISWSLAVEEQYYMIWPLLLLLMPRRWVVGALVVLISWNIAVALDLFTLIGITAIQAGPLKLSVHSPTYAPILMGSLLAVLLHRPTGFAALYRLTGFRNAPWVWIGLLLVAYAALPTILAGWPNLVMHSLMCMIIASLVIREDHTAAPVMQLPPLRRIGQISYGVYIYHLFALAIVAELFERTVGIPGHWGYIMVLYYALAVLISEISFRTLEAWFTRLRDRNRLQHPISPGSRG